MGNQFGLGRDQFVEIEAGDFRIGSTGGEYDEVPVHDVNISRPFLMGLTEVTQARWRAVTGSNPSSFSDCGDSCPVDNVSLDLGHNFVLAHATCNERKGDRLAAEEHLQRWAERNVDHGGALAAAFDELGLLHDLAATARVAEWAYQQVEQTRGRVWVQGSELRLLRERWRGVMES